MASVVRVTAPPFGRTVPGNRWDLARDDPVPARTVSVVVTHYDQPVQLARTLAALRRQTRPAHELIVADDGSDPAPDPGPGVRVVRQCDRGFRAAAVRNLGASRATGEVLVFLDADTTPEPGFLEHLVRLPSRLPELFAVGRRRHADLSGMPGSGSRVELVGPLHELTEPAWLRRGNAETSDLLHADVRSHRFVIASVLACTRWWFDQLGGFDERFVGYGGEDYELAARSWRRGGLVAHAPDAVAWHDGAAAGEAGRPVGSVDGPVLDQSRALADRVGAPGATYRGLLLGPPDLVVTVDPAMGPRAVAVTVDSLLAAVPRARIRLPSAATEWLVGDPRVATTPTGPGPGVWSDSDSNFRLHLHLDAPVIGPPEAWTDVAARGDTAEVAATCTLLDADGSPFGSLHDLRQHRRARRWPGVAGLVGRETERVALRSAADVGLQAWLEGWA